jgi:hypothetical protein
MRPTKGYDIYSTGSGIAYSSTRRLRCASSGIRRTSTLGRAKASCPGSPASLTPTKCRPARHRPRYHSLLRRRQCRVGTATAGRPRSHRGAEATLRSPRPRSIAALGIRLVPRRPQADLKVGLYVYLARLRRLLWGTCRTTWTPACGSATRLLGDTTSPRFRFTRRQYPAMRTVP